MEKKKKLDSEKKKKKNFQLLSKKSKPIKVEKMSLTRPMTTTTKKFSQVKKKILLFNNEYYLEKKFEKIRIEQEERLSKNARKFRRNKKLQKKAEKIRMQNLKHQVEIFDKRMEQGDQLSNALKFSNNFLYQEAVKKAKEKKEKILKKQYKIILNNIFEIVF